MNEQGYDVQEVIQEGGKFFDPTYLNLEYFFNRVFDFFTSFGASFSAFSGGSFFVPYIKAFLSIIAIICITGIIYCIIRIREVREEEEKLYQFAEPVPTENPGDVKWIKIKKYLESPNESDWRFAIIEADTILDEIVLAMGYTGDNLGERLKKVEPSDFDTLEAAWEAHKVRNRIAHEGSDYQLNLHEARRVIALYEKVFQEFQYI